MSQKRLNVQMQHWQLSLLRDRLWEQSRVSFKSPRKISIRWSLRSRSHWSTFCSLPRENHSQAQIMHQSPGGKSGALNKDPFMQEANGSRSTSLVYGKGKKK